MVSSEEALAGINRKIRADEPDYLKYLIDNCNNILFSTFGATYSPPILQLMKIRAEARQRLEEIYGIDYEGKGR